MTKNCPACKGSRTVVVGYYPETYVSHDMAMDAGEPSMEGDVYTEEEYIYDACPDCAYVNLDGWQEGSDAKQ